MSTIYFNGKHWVLMFRGSARNYFDTLDKAIAFRADVLNGYV